MQLWTATTSAALDIRSNVAQLFCAPQANCSNTSNLQQQQAVAATSCWTNSMHWKHHAQHRQAAVAATLCMWRPCCMLYQHKEHCLECCICNCSSTCFSGSLVQRLAGTKATSPPLPSAVGHVVLHKWVIPCVCLLILYWTPSCTVLGYVKCQLLLITFHM